MRRLTTTRAQRAAALEVWAENVDADELVVANTDALRLIAELAERRDGLDEALAKAVRTHVCQVGEFGELGGGQHPGFVDDHGRSDGGS